MKKKIYLILAIFLFVIFLIVGILALKQILTPSFKATIEAMAEGYMLVTPEEGEEIRKSADKISFSTKGIEIKNLKAGDKVKITYTGEIRESYPAQIDIKKIKEI